MLNISLVFEKKRFNKNKEKNCVAAVAMAAPTVLNTGMRTKFSTTFKTADKTAVTIIIF
jgi:hypothetical protein